MINRAILPVLCAGVLTACGVNFTAKPPASGDRGDVPTALTYFLPKDVIEVTAEREVVRQTSLVENNGIISKNKTETVKLASVNIAVTTIPDAEFPYLLDARSPGMYKNDTTISVSDTGLLQSINAKTSGSAGVVFQNVLKIAGTVLPLISPSSTINKAVNEAFSSALPLDSYASDTGGQTVWTSSINSRARQFVRLSAVASLPPQDPCSSQFSISSSAEAGQFLGKYFANTLPLRFALPNVPDRERLRMDFCEALAKQTSSEQDIQATMQLIGGLQDEATLKGVQIRFGAQVAERNRAQAVLDTARLALTNAIASKLVEEEIGKIRDTQPRKFILDVKDLPTSAQIAGLIGNDPAGTTLSLQEVDRALVTAKVGLDIWRQLHVIITLDEYAPPASLINDSAKARVQSNVGKCWIQKDTQSTVKSSPCVYFREASTHVLSVWIPYSPHSDSAGDNILLSLKEQRIVSLIRSNAATRALPLPANPFTKRDTQLTFSPQGRLVQVRRDSGSAAEDATGSIQQGLRAGVTDYQTSQAALKTIRETDQAIALQPLQNEIATAEAQLKLIKARVSLQGASTSESQLLATELTTIEKNLLAVQDQLVVTSNQLIRDTTTADSLVTDLAIAQKTNLVAIEVQQLKNEIELLKLQAQLKDLSITH